MAKRSRKRRRRAGRKMRHCSVSKTNPVLRRAVLEWLERVGREEGLQKLEEGKIKLGFTLALLSDEGIEERILFGLLDKFENVTGLNIKQTLLDGAKWNLWGEEDYFPEIATYDQLLLQLAWCYENYQPSKKALVSELGISNGWVIINWIKGRYKIKTSVIEKILRILLRLKKLERYKELYPGEPVAPAVVPVAPKSPRPPKVVRERKNRTSADSDKALRLAINGCFSAVLGHVNLLNLLLPDDKGKIILGDKAKAVSSARSLLDVFGVNEGVLKELVRTEPLSSGNIKLLEGIFRGRENNE